MAPFSLFVCIRQSLSLSLWCFKCRFLQYTRLRVKSYHQPTFKSWNIQLARIKISLQNVKASRMRNHKALVHVKLRVTKIVFRSNSVTKKFRNNNPTLQHLHSSIRKFRDNYVYSSWISSVQTVFRKKRV